MDDKKYVMLIALLSEANYLAVTGIAEGENTEDVILRICAQILWEFKQYRQDVIRDYGIPSPEYDKANDLHQQAMEAVEKHLPEGMSLQTVYGSKYFSDNSLEVTDEIRYFAEAIRSIQEVNAATAVKWADYTPGPVVYVVGSVSPINYMMEFWHQPDPVEKPPVGPKPRIKRREPNHSKRRTKYWEGGNKF